MRLSQAPASADELALQSIFLRDGGCIPKNTSTSPRTKRKAKLRQSCQICILIWEEYLRTCRRTSRKNYAAFFAGVFNSSIAFLKTASSGESGLGSAGAVAGAPFAESSSSAPSSAAAASGRTTSDGVTPSSKIDFPFAL